MTHVFLYVFAIILVLPMAVHAQVAQDAGGKVITARLIAQRITLDGRLDEATWKDASPLSEFTQRELVEGAPATEKTEVRILYDEENLYIGVKCFDSDPGGIIHREMARDADIDTDDNFTVVLDTFADKRNGYYFRTNPNGVIKDGLVANGVLDESWNGVWDVRSAMLADGWSAEMLIPFKTLRFSAVSGTDWGINFRRVIRRKNEQVLWTAWGLNDGIFQFSKCGALAGLSDIRRSRQLDFKPYVLGGLEKVGGADLDRNFKYGLDVKYPVTSQLTLDLTTYTDFAQVESDREQINLTQFDISYPEKREFFLEGADIFSFASSNTNPFYSRRIGLTPDREQMPILGGAKLVGKAGAYNIGVIEMQTDDKDGYSGANYSVIRVKKDVLEKSYVGFIATNASPGRGSSNQAYGADFLYRTDRFLSDQNFEFGGYLAQNRAEGVRHGTRAGRVLMNLPNDAYSVSLLYHAVGANYNPETGFVRRRDIRQHHAEFMLTPRPGIPGVKKLLFTPLSMDYYTDTGTRLVTRTTNFRPLGIEFNSGDAVEVNISGSYELVERPFERFRGKMKVPAGVHTWWDYEFEVTTSENRPFNLGIHSHTGTFYNGDRDWVMTQLGMKTSKYYSLSADYTMQRVTMGGNRFDIHDVGTRIGINITPRLTANSLIQYNNDTGKVNLNFRLHYIPKVGSDIYFVYNHLWDEEDDFRTLQNTGVCKIAYLVQY